MIINTAGEYTLQYTATDACGNSTTVQRDLVVEAPPTYRTVLYTDGTFIINESSRDEAANVQAHGQPTNVYAPFDPNGATVADKYIFSGPYNRPWNAKASSIKSVEIGQQIQPSDTKYWFDGLTTCENIDVSNLDTSLSVNTECMFRDCRAITSLGVMNTSSSTIMVSMFQGCISLQTIDTSEFYTSHVTNMNEMFRDCLALTELDLSTFDTSLVTSAYSMFHNCGALKTIYASASFVTSQITSSNYMFQGDTSLVGGAGTTYKSFFTDKTRAKIDGGTSDPGYFTAKS